MVFRRFSYKKKKKEAEIMSIDKPSISIPSKDLETCVKVLSKFHANDGHPSIESNEYERVRPLINNLFHIGRRLKHKRLQANPQQTEQKNKKSKNVSSPRPVQAKKPQHTLVPETESIEDDNRIPSPERLTQSHTCSICKLKYRTLHFFYDQLCPGCAKLNYEKRFQTADLTNSIALVTGGRVKHGYRTVLKLLRANCFVITTTRFPMDFLNRLNKEEDFDQWKDRVHIYGVDFRYSQLVEIFTQMIVEKYDKLDFLINNACHTIQRSHDDYPHENLTNYSLLPNDQQKILEGNLQLAPIANRLSLPSTNESSSLIVHQQSLDFPSTNSSILRLEELSTNEISEVLTVNTLAPIILTSKLKVLMADKHPNPDSIKFVINVSAMEGSFSHATKTDQHPHINAAKAALNMITRTSAIDYKQSNIYMVSVDAG